MFRKSIFKVLFFAVLYLTAMPFAVYNVKAYSNGITYRYAVCKEYKINKGSIYKFNISLNREPYQSYPSCGTTTAYKFNVDVGYCLGSIHTALFSDEIKGNVYKSKKTYVGTKYYADIYSHYNSDEYYCDIYEVSSCESLPTADVCKKYSGSITGNYYDQSCYLDGNKCITKKGELRKASSDGCYSCWSSASNSRNCVYYEKGSVMPLTCNQYKNSSDCIQSGTSCRSKSTARTAPSNGCYACGGTSGYSCVYFRKGSNLGSACSNSPVSSSVCKQIGTSCSKPSTTTKTTTTTKATTTATSRTAPSNGCYACGGTSGYSCVYFRKGSNLGSACSNSPVSSSVCKQIGTSCSKPSTTTKTTTKTTKKSSTTRKRTTTRRAGVIAPTVLITTQEDRVIVDNTNTEMYAMSDALYQGENIVSGDKLYISGCDSTYCYVDKINGKNVSTTTIVLKSRITSEYVNKDNVINNNECINSSVNNHKGKITVNICYKKENDLYVSELSEIDAVSCANNYSLTYHMIEDNCKDNSFNNCTKRFEYVCKSKIKPEVEIKNITSDLNGEGTVKFIGIDKNNVGLSGYYISNGESPMINSVWEKFETETIEKVLKAGTYYIWVKDTEDNISKSKVVEISDSETTTTLDTLNITSVDGTIAYFKKIVDTNKDGFALSNRNYKYVRLANNIGDVFNSYNTSYEIDVDADKIAVYATLTSNDSSYVKGYEPRTVNLKYGKNVILLKIINKHGRERVYTIIANRVDNRDNNNLLYSLSVSHGKINFDPYTSDYTIKVGSNINEVSINGEIDSNLSSFVKGFEPRKVALNNDVTSAIIKVVSEAGIIRSYVLTFIKSEGEDQNIDNSTYLSSLSIPGTKLEFDRETDSYSVSVEYEIEELPVYAFAESKNANVTIKGNNNLRVGPNLIEISVKNGQKYKLYTVYVNRKESGLSVTSSTDLESFTVKDYKISFSPDKIDYVLKIKREKTLLITATPASNRSEVYMYGNNNLTGFSTIRIKVIAEDGATKIYSLDIQKDAFNMKLEKILSISAISVVVIGSAIYFIIRSKKKRNEYLGI